MASKIKVDQIEGSTGSSITIPSGQTLTIADGLSASTIGSGTLSSDRLPTVPVSKGGTGITSLGTANQIIQVNSGATALEFVEKPEGKLKQIVNGYYENGASSWTTTSTSFVDTPMTFNITPTSTSSKILVVFNTNGSWSSSGGGNAIFTIKRDIGGTATDLGAGSQYALVHTYNTSPVQMCVSKVDEPNTTSQITYTLQTKNDGQTTYAFRDRTQNTYYAMEIA